MNHLNPGSQPALDAGCRCPVMDNHYGHKGSPWWISELCPIHAPEVFGEVAVRLNRIGADK